MDSIDAYPGSAAIRTLNKSAWICETSCLSDGIVTGSGITLRQGQEAGYHMKLYIDDESDEDQDNNVGNFREFIRRLVSKDKLTVELGPSYAATCPKRLGYKVVIVDFIDADALRSKHSSMGQEVTDSIEAVDFIWRGGKIADLVKERVSAIVACHVVEHMPDFIGFLRDCEDLLEKDGQIFLIVPDKRFCFDFLKEVSDPAKFMGDHFRHAERHSFESLYRNCLNTFVWRSGVSTVAWDPSKVEDFHFLSGDPKLHYDQALSACAGLEYVDAHGSYFTPVSFLMVIDELRYLGFTSLSIETLTKTRGCEFLVTLRHSSAEKPALENFIATKKRRSYMRLNEELKQLEALLAPRPIEVQSK
jgi:hypothetical protein